MSTWAFEIWVAFLFWIATSSGQCQLVSCPYRLQLAHRLAFWPNCQGLAANHAACTMTLLPHLKRAALPRQNRPKLNSIYGEKIAGQSLQNATFCWCVEGLANWWQFTSTAYGNIIILPQVFDMQNSFLCIYAWIGWKKKACATTPKENLNKDIQNIGQTNTSSSWTTPQNSKAENHLMVMSVDVKIYTGKSDPSKSYRLHVKFSRFCPSERLHQWDDKVSWLNIAVLAWIAASNPNLWSMICTKSQPWLGTLSKV